MHKFRIELVLLNLKLLTRLREINDAVRGDDDMAGREVFCGSAVEAKDKAELAGNTVLSVI